MSFEIIEKEALELPMQEPAKLAQRLLESPDQASETETEQLWLEVAARRAEEIDRDMVQLVSADELEIRVLARLT